MVIPFAVGRTSLFSGSSVTGEGSLTFALINDRLIEILKETKAGTNEAVIK